MSRSRGKLLTGVVVVFGVLAYLYSRRSAAQSGQASAAGSPQLSPGSQAVTSQQVSSSSSFWTTLQSVQGPGQGYVNFPTPGGSISQAAAAVLPWAMDQNGSYYTQWAGRVFVVGSQDDSGNWPAMAVA